MSLWDDYRAEAQFAHDFPHGINNDEWTTKNGQTLKVKDMSTDHIMNCMNMLSKQESRDDFYYVFEEELRRRRQSLI